MTPTEAEPSLPGEGILPAASPRRAPVNEQTLKFTKSYIVTGPFPVEGATKGSIVSLSLTAGQESDLIEAGHIELAP